MFTICDRVFNRFCIEKRILESLVKALVATFPQGLDPGAASGPHLEPPTVRLRFLERDEPVAAASQLGRSIGPLDQHPSRGSFEPIPQAEILELALARKSVEIEMHDGDVADGVMLEQRVRRRRHPRLIAETAQQRADERRLTGAEVST